MPPTFAVLAQLREGHIWLGLYHEPASPAAQTPQEEDLLGQVSSVPFVFCGEEACILTDSHAVTAHGAGRDTASLEGLVANTGCLLRTEHSTPMVSFNFHHNPVVLVSFQV